MEFLKHIIKTAGGAVVGNPSVSIGCCTFAMGFALIAANALFSQPGSHPGPIWATSDAMVTKSVSGRKTARVETRTVVTQKISMKKVPVPTLKPVPLPEKDAPLAQPQTKTPDPVIRDASMVAKIQLGLNNFGVDGIAVDGIYGAQTATAIRQFQKRFELRVDGEPNHEVLKKLQEIGALRNI